MLDENAQFYAQWIRVIPTAVLEVCFILLFIVNCDSWIGKAVKLNFLNLEMGQSFPVHFLRLNCIVKSGARHFEVCQISGCAQIGGDFHVDFRRQIQNWHFECVSDYLKIPDKKCILGRIPFPTTRWWFIQPTDPPDLIYPLILENRKWNWTHKGGTQKHGHQIYKLWTALLVCTCFISTVQSKSVITYTSFCHQNQSVTRKVVVIKEVFYTGNAL